ncbi:MAG: hypothetical protein QW057_06470 [Candidatus Bathyarchaeia archaeon]
MNSKDSFLDVKILTGKRGLVMSREKRQRLLNYLSDTTLIRTRIEPPGPGGIGEDVIHGDEGDFA